jgi:predicted nicotinamide N-methyase
VPLRHRYQTYELGDEDIHVRSLRDTQQYSDPQGKALALGISAANWALFGVVWDSSQVLARHMAGFDIQGKRILELGCGLALSSLLLNRRGGDITATDYHPESGPFLLANTRLNRDRAIPYFQADWQKKKSNNGRFDLIIGSDVLYERGHLKRLAGFIESHAQPLCEVLIVDPGRKQTGAFSRLLCGYGFSHSQFKPADTAYLKKAFSGSILSYKR